jgi:aryl-alcohol dehydrogenase-like predicted oxidoreductase
MEYTLLGKTGIKVSRICLGTMTFGYILEEKESRALIERAIELGINFFDTANVYGGGRSEEILGAALKDRRDEVIIASKVFWSHRQPQAEGLSRSFVFKELTDSLERLQTDYIDIYYAHRYDPNVSVDNVLRTFNRAINDGKVRHIGASTMHAWELAKSFWVADRLGLEPFQIVQPLYNLLYREEERELFGLCRDQKIAVAPWAPLAQGVLTGKYSREGLPDTPRAKGLDLQHWFLREQDFVIADRVAEVAREKGVSPAQIALAWVLSKAVITTPIVGVTKMEHLEQAVEAIEINLSEEEVAYLEELYQPRELVGHYGGQPMAGDRQE